MGDNRRRGLAIAAAITAGVLATGGGLALASKKPKKTIPIASDGTITACARQHDGRLRLVANASQCTKHEQVVTWNKTGPGIDAAPGDVVVGSLTLGPVNAQPPNTVPIHAFSFGATNQTVISSGGGGGAGKVKVADIEVLKDIDDLTLDSTEGVFTGKRFPTLTIVLFDPGATTTRATYTLKNVFFTGTQQFSAGALERLTVAYSQITVDVGGATFGYDLAGNKKL
jgi:type VI protein secretion system component Hcp